VVTGGVAESQRGMLVVRRRLSGIRPLTGLAFRPGRGASADLVQRRFEPPAPDRLCVAGLTYVSTWSGFAYVAFVVDAYARRILGWRVAPTMATSMVLDAIEQAIWTRQQEGALDLKDVVHHAGRGSSTPRSGSPNASPRRAFSPRSQRSAARMTMRWPKTINGLHKDRADQAPQALADHRGSRAGYCQMGHWFNHRRLYQ
jgi:putative transposase